MEAVFDFEKPIVNLERKLQDLRELARQENVDFSNEIKVLETKVESLIDEIYSKLGPWQKVQLSRHPNRPYSRDYIDLLFPDFMELQGDRTFGDDQAILGGIATWPPKIPQNSTSRSSSQSPSQPGINHSSGNNTPSDTASSQHNGFHEHLSATFKTQEQNIKSNFDSEQPIPILILGHQKGRTTKQKMERNFGMAKPEGYRKAMRLMALANRSKMPILTFIDTPGAYPGIEAEERGQSQAIAECIRFMFTLEVPILSIVIGEGGSGGALAIGVGNRVLMQEYSTYSVISPESCASILWSDSSLAERASEKLKMNPQELIKLGVIDRVIPEPKGGAHRDWNLASRLLRAALIENLDSLMKQWKSNPQKLIDDRIAKFRSMGQSSLDHAPVSAGV